MGINPRTLSPSARAAAGIVLAGGGRALPPCSAYLTGHVLLELAVTPPTVTHHAKRIVRRGGRATLADRPELVAARRLYELAIPERPGPTLAPLTPPVVLRVTWMFAVQSIGAAGGPTCWHADKPDFDNSCKVLTDVLAARRYLVDDCQVALAVVAKRCGPLPGVRVYLRTLVSADDGGAEYALPAGAARGLIHPLPEVFAADAAAAARASRAAGERPYPGFVHAGAHSQGVTR